MIYAKVNRKVLTCDLLHFILLLGAELPEDQLLQSSAPGPLDKEGKNVEDVLNIISQSIFREGEGHILLKLCDRSSLLSVVSHSLSAYITTLGIFYKQQLNRLPS